MILSEWHRQITDEDDDLVSQTDYRKQKITYSEAIKSMNTEICLDEISSERE